MKIHFTFSAFISLWLAGSAYSADVPPIKAGEKPIPDTTEAELWYGMDQAEKNIRLSPYIVHDKALNAYVKDITCRVAGEYCPDLRLYIVDVPVFNASMAPNGVVLVFTGALLRMQDEAELALVLSHEFAHYRQRHSLQGWQKQKKSAAFLAGFGVLTWAGGVGLVGSLAQFAGLANMMQFSREMEREADKQGFAIAVALGYDPQAGSRLWQRMQREESANVRAKYNPVFASHPKTLERMEDLAAAAAAYPAGTGQTFQTRYDEAMTPSLGHWLDQELSRRMYDSSIVVIGDLLDSARPDLLGMYEFYLGEAYRRRGQSGDNTRSAELYAKAVTREQTPAAAWRELGMAKAAEGQKLAAIENLRLYLKKNPDAEDRQFVLADINKLEKSP